MNGPPTSFWGKLSSDDGGHVIAWHPLEAHCADVAACLEGLLQQSVMRRRLARLGGIEALDDVQVARLGVLAFLHDLGKINVGFQAKALPEATRTAGHVREAVALFQPCPESAALANAIGFDRMEQWGETPETASELLLAAICHHGRPQRIDFHVEPSLWLQGPLGDPFSGAAMLMRCAEAAFSLAFRPGGEPLPSAPAFQHAFSGLVMLADWLGSDTKFFPFAEVQEGARIDFARGQVREAMARIGLDAEPARAALDGKRAGFTSISPFQPRAAQKAVDELPCAREGGLDILEAETGAGKTEAALTRYITLFQQGEVDGLYFALPTRTAATQIHTRVVEAVAHAFPRPEDRPPVVLAVPGYIAVDDVSGTRLPGFEVLWPDDDRERWRFRGWAAENPKRYLAAAVVVGTIDQVLLSALAVGHSHLRASALLRHLLVVDEVHASDAYMNRLLEVVLARHLRSGGHAFLMSATLGATARDRFISVAKNAIRTQTPGSLSFAEAIEVPYPLVTWWRPNDATTSVVIAEPGNPKTIGVHLRPWGEAPDTIAQAGLDAARQGARVLIIRNTVRDCLDVQTALERLADLAGAQALLFGCAGAPAPHHSRFSKDDRTALDHALEARLGKNSPHGGLVVVATQTVQQSLDIDADLLITDLCPMDVLLQRCGRLQRHGDRERPIGFEPPAPALVLTPATRDLGTLLGRDGIARGGQGLGSVYDDLRIIEATWRELEISETLQIPHSCRALVEATTHPEALAAVVSQGGGAWERHERVVRGALLSDRRTADLNLANWQAPFGSDEIAFPSGEMDRRIQTRLGEGDRQVMLEPPLAGPFGMKVRALTLPAHFARGSGADALPDAIAVNPGGFEFSFGPRRFRYDRLGLRPATLEPDPTEDDYADA